jgi:hypothetical protein
MQKQNLIIHTVICNIICGCVWANTTVNGTILTVLTSFLECEQLWKETQL